MGLHTPFLSLGTDAWTGKPYHLCSRKVTTALLSDLVPGCV